MDHASRPALDRLRADIVRLEARHSSRPFAVLPFGVRQIDMRPSGGGVAWGALHEVAGGGADVVHGTAAALFAAGIPVAAGLLARAPGLVLWCLTRPDLFAPALAQAGPDPDRVIFAEAGDETSVLAFAEEGLRHGGLGGVVAEVAKLPMTASRRLQLAAEEGHTLGLALRRWRRPAEASDFGRPTAARTRWRVSALPSGPLPRVGRARWLVELVRAPAGASADFVLEACDEQGRLAVPAELARRPTPAQAGRGRAAP